MFILQKNNSGWWLGTCGDRTGTANLITGYFPSGTVENNLENVDHNFPKSELIILKQESFSATSYDDKQNIIQGKGMKS